MLYNKKLVKCGNIYHYYDYDTRYFKRGYSRNKRTLPGVGRVIREYSEEVIGEKRLTHIWRAKRSVKFILESNAYRGGVKPVFITLTFAENVRDLKVANYEFTKFIQRFSYKVGYKLKYLVVPEFQKRGAVHFHVVFFNLSYLFRIYDVVSSVWGHGFSFVEVIKDIQHLINYVCKYFTKQGSDSRLFGEKSYFCSRGLFREEVVYGYDRDLVDNSFISKFKKEYKIKDYKVIYEQLEKWIL